MTTAAFSALSFAQGTAPTQETNTTQENVIVFDDKSIVLEDGGIGIGEFVEEHIQALDETSRKLTRVIGLRGVIQELAQTSSEEVRDSLNRLIDEKIDPLINKADYVVQRRIEHAGKEAQHSILQLESSMKRIINLATHQAHSLNSVFFAKLSEQLDKTSASLDRLIEAALCKSMPDGRVIVAVGPFDGVDSIVVWRPAETACYALYLGAETNPLWATFRRFQFFEGELCEAELRLKEISPYDGNSIEKVASAYELLVERAEAARCAAPTPERKAFMAKKSYEYSKRALFFRNLRALSR